MQPLWKIAGFALGAGTALLGKKAAMTCTVAVEEVIDEHYQEQLDYFDKDENGDSFNRELKDKINKISTKMINIWKSKLKKWEIIFLETIIGKLSNYFPITKMLSLSSFILQSLLF